MQQDPVLPAACMADMSEHDFPMASWQLEMQCTAIRCLLHVLCDLKVDIGVCLYVGVPQWNR